MAALSDASGDTPERELWGEIHRYTISIRQPAAFQRFNRLM